MLNTLSPGPAFRPVHCDIFCVVIDNYGDAGVCWRLARQLAEEYGWQVQLYIDNPALLALLAPDHAQSPVTVVPWPHAVLPPALSSVPSDAPHDSPADVVIEAFACTLPEVYTEAMARREKKPVWLNLEYLSAENWVGELHSKPSPHPRLPLVKHFFFPGFDERSGGLLREADYDARRSTFDAAAFRAEFGLPEKMADELTISLFSYPAAPVTQLMQALGQEHRPVRLLLPGSNAKALTQGALSTHPLPFLPQARYDELLWACDLNFVRGEDSFVRAQWAGKPFVWQIYPQTDNVHRVKLDAFLARYMQKGIVDNPRVLPAGHADNTTDEAPAQQEGAIQSPARAAGDAPQGGQARSAPSAVADGKAANNSANEVMHTFWLAWNSSGTLNWPAFSAALPALAQSALFWSIALKKQRDLADNLVQFCLERLK